MSQENVEKVRAVYERWSEGDFRAGGELFAPDVAFEPMVDGQTALDRDAIEGQMRDFLAQWSEFRVEAEQFTDFSEAVLVTERQHGRGKSSGVETEATFYAVWTFRDGLVVRLRWDSNRAGALEAAGLSE